MIMGLRWKLLRWVRVLGPALSEARQLHMGVHQYDAARHPHSHAALQCHSAYLRPQLIPQPRVVPPNAALCVESGRQRPPHTLGRVACKAPVSKHGATVAPVCLLP